MIGPDSIVGLTGKAGGAAAAVAARLMIEIDAGRLAPGMRLPSTADLARSHGVTVHAMQSALSGLQRRGILKRTRRLGTFVTLGAGGATLGIVMRGNLLTEPRMRFYGVLIDRLMRELPPLGFQLRMYAPTPDGGLGRDFLDDADAGRLSAVLVMDRQLGDALPSGRHGQVPVVEVPMPDYESLAYQGALHLLQDGGAGRIAAIPSDQDIGTEAFRRGLVQALVEIGADPGRIVLLPGGNNDACGHGAVERLAGDLPGAWLVGDDNTARGVVSALLLRGVRLPGGARIVTHANRGLPAFPPLDLTRLEINPQAVVRGILANLQARLDGSDAPVPRIHPVFIAGAT